MHRKINYDHNYLEIDLRERRHKIRHMRHKMERGQNGRQKR